MNRNIRKEEKLVKEKNKQSNVKLKSDFKKYLIEKYLELEYDGIKTYESNRHLLKAKLYNDFISGDISRTLDAAKIIRHLDNLEFSKVELANIKLATSNLPESDICRMYDYRLDVKNGIKVIENFTNGNECKCNLYVESERISPEREIELGMVELLEKYVNKQKYQIEYNLRCKTCKTEWFVIEQHSYHYPWSKWLKK